MSLLTFKFSFVVTLKIFRVFIKTHVRSVRLKGVQKNTRLKCLHILTYTTKFCLAAMNSSGSQLIFLKTASQ